LECLQVQLTVAFDGFQGVFISFPAFEAGAVPVKEFKLAVADQGKACR